MDKGKTTLLEPWAKPQKAELGYYNKFMINNRTWYTFSIPSLLFSSLTLPFLHFPSPPPLPSLPPCPFLPLPIACLIENANSLYNKVSPIEKSLSKHLHDFVGFLTINIRSDLYVFVSFTSLNRATYRGLQVQLQLIDSLHLKGNALWMRLFIENITLNLDIDNLMNWHISRAIGSARLGPTEPIPARPIPTVNFFDN